VSAHDPSNPEDRRRADAARARFRAREARLAREAAERAEHEARRTEAAGLDPVAAALARAQARKRGDA
jgi:electron transport complex protein RnfB